MRLFDLIVRVRVRFRVMARVMARVRVRTRVRIRVQAKISLIGMHCSLLFEWHLRFQHWNYPSKVAPKT